MPDQNCTQNSPALMRTRRRLLKGAASSPVILGVSYGADAAATSSCLRNGSGVTSNVLTPGPQTRGDYFRAQIFMVRTAGAASPLTPAFFFMRDPAHLNAFFEASVTGTAVDGIPPAYTAYPFDNAAGNGSGLALEPTQTYIALNQYALVLFDVASPGATPIYMGPIDGQAVNTNVTGTRHVGESCWASLNGLTSASGSNW